MRQCFILEDEREKTSKYLNLLLFQFKYIYLKLCVLLCFFSLIFLDNGHKLFAFSLLTDALMLADALLFTPGFHGLQKNFMHPFSVTVTSYNQKYDPIAGSTGPLFSLHTLYAYKKTKPISLLG